ncbi:MAG: hypothetical protein Q8P41_05235 [Pseudomonadota bacterium]|nr:hypothetical protein [Pseudomonadota bacterium]
MLGLLGAMAGFLGCAPATDGRVAPERPEPVTVVAPPGAAAASAPGGDPAEADLLGLAGDAVFAPGGLGMRGEGPQNGGPSYGPGLADIPPGGLGHGAGGADDSPASQLSRQWGHWGKADPDAEHLGANVWVEIEAAPAGADAPAMLTVARSYRRQLERCYALENGDAREDEARVAVSLRTNGTGETAEVSAATLSEPVRVCIASQFRRMPFSPPPGGSGVATFRLRMAVRTCDSCN